jgi:hypothetical protein
MRLGAQARHGEHQFGAAIAAIREMSVLSGVERKEVRRPGEFDALTDDELERALRERLNSLGLLTPDAGSDTRH